MIGKQIALTGLLMAVMALSLIILDGRPAKIVPYWRVASLVSILLLGAAAVIVGIIMMIWGQ